MSGTNEQDWMMGEQDPTLERPGRDLRASSNPLSLGRTWLRHTCRLLALSTVSSMPRTWAQVNSEALSYQAALREGGFLDQV